MTKEEFKEILNMQHGAARELELRKEYGEGTTYIGVLIEKYGDMYLDVIDEIIGESKSEILGEFMSYVPESFRKRHSELCVKAFDRDKKMFCYLPKEVVTPEIIASVDSESWEQLAREVKCTNMPKNIYKKYGVDVSSECLVPGNGCSRLPDEIAITKKGNFTREALKIIQQAATLMDLEYIRQCLPEGAERLIPKEIIENIEKANRLSRANEEARKIYEKGKESVLKIPNYYGPIEPYDSTEEGINNDKINDLHEKTQKIAANWPGRTGGSANGPAR